MDNYRLDYCLGHPGTDQSCDSEHASTQHILCHGQRSILQKDSFSVIDFPRSGCLGQQKEDWASERARAQNTLFGDGIFSLIDLSKLGVFGQPRANQKTGPVRMQAHRTCCRETEF